MRILYEYVLLALLVRKSMRDTPCIEIRLSSIVIILINYYSIFSLLPAYLFALRYSCRAGCLIPCVITPTILMAQNSQFALYLACILVKADCRLKNAKCIIRRGAEEPARIEG